MRKGPLVLRFTCRDWVTGPVELKPTTPSTEGAAISAIMKPPIAAAVAATASGGIFRNTTSQMNRGKESYIYIYIDHHDACP